MNHVWVAVLQFRHIYPINGRTNAAFTAALARQRERFMSAIWHRYGTMGLCPFKNLLRFER